MAYLAGGQEAIRRRAAGDDAVTVLDHGPIFRLALLHEFGPPMTKDRHYAQWWSRMLAQWANTLSLVIWLDASDGVLLHRIQTRNRAHRIKGKSEHDICEFLVRYRSVYRDIIEKLAGLQGPTLLSFDTERQSSEQIVREVLAAFEAGRKKLTLL
jgi:deoxyadenosine/deoxycytidine kinase